MLGRSQIELDALPPHNFVLSCNKTTMNITAGLSNRGIRDESEKEMVEWKGEWIIRCWILSAVEMYLKLRL